jgi:hypothetical protein
MRQSLPLPNTDDPWPVGVNGVKVVILILDMIMIIIKPNPIIIVSD